MYLFSCIARLDGFIEHKEEALEEDDTKAKALIQKKRWWSTSFLCKLFFFRNASCLPLTTTTTQALSLLCLSYDIGLAYFFICDHKDIYFACALGKTYAWVHCGCIIKVYKGRSKRRYKRWNVSKKTTRWYKNDYNTFNWCITLYRKLIPIPLRMNLFNF